MVGYLSCPFAIPVLFVPLQNTFFSLAGIANRFQQPDHPQLSSSAVCWPTSSTYQGSPVRGVLIGGVCLNQGFFLERRRAAEPENQGFLVAGYTMSLISSLGTES